MIDSESESTMTVLQEVRSPSIPANAHVLTVLVSHPPGAAGYPPHRLPGGPGFGYMIDGEMLFEIEGEAPRVLRAGDAFWGSGGDVIHYRDANNRADIPCSFVLTLLCAPGRPVLEPVTDEDLQHRKPQRVSAISASASSDDERKRQWREVTRELVLTGATATVAVPAPQAHASMSISVKGKALSEDLLLATTGNVAMPSVDDNTDTYTRSMSVVPMRLDVLSQVPEISVLAHGMTEPAELRLVVELAARNPQNHTASVLRCEFDSVRLDPQAPLARLEFEPQHVESRR
ncbi:cupin [Mycolicibacterium mageritense DSM 44476 = CIP 104973]|uniref:Cupin n=1 Tax=Mycolicibacterium mageritense TaxID=53462 RepID=A0ABN5Y515_MYCME|nr:cupin [Mycolicibacterium mageritense]CDO21683.1 cupin [Mycolicibacterium mageritense DSM 44476 = CIP 104973]